VLHISGCLFLTLHRVLPVRRFRGALLSIVRVMHKILRNVGRYLPHYTVLRPTRTSYYRMPCFLPTFVLSWVHPATASTFFHSSPVLCLRLVRQDSDLQTPARFIDVVLGNVTLKQLSAASHEIPWCCGFGYFCLSVCPLVLSPKLLDGFRLYLVLLTPASYSGRSRFDSVPRLPAILIEVYVVFLSISR
jgi:hypothetical protein